MRVSTEGCFSCRLPAVKLSPSVTGAVPEAVDTKFGLLPKSGFY